MNITKKTYDPELKLLTVEFKTENGISAYEFTNEQILEHLFRDFTDTSKLQLIDWYNEPQAILWARNYFLDDLFVKTLVARRFGEEKALIEISKPKSDIWEVGKRVRIVNQICGHQFSIGEEVELLASWEEGKVWTAKGIKDWSYIVKDEAELI